MTIRAYAKINIGLQILGRRPDGYHNIETIFHQIDCFDEVELTPHEDGIRFSSEHSFGEAGEENLCVRSARILQQQTETTKGVEIKLRKHIPIGAGLGGGSSDAAAVLKGLNSRWGLHLSDRDLMNLASMIGSDVPFFLAGKTCLGTGRGEILEPIDISVPYWILVCTPALHVSTTWAYSHYKPSPYLRHENLRSLMAEFLHQPRVLVNKLRNDFEPIVFRAHSEVMRVKEMLVRSGADFALMSGSGSSVFAFFVDESFARDAHGELSKLCTVSLTEPHFKPEPVHYQN